MRPRIYDLPLFAEPAWCGRCAACAAVQRRPALACGCPVGSACESGPETFELVPAARRRGGGPASVACLHLLGLRLAHALYYRAPMTLLPRLRQRHMLAQAAVMGSRRVTAAGPALIDVDQVGLTWPQALALVTAHLAHLQEQGLLAEQTVQKTGSELASLVRFMTDGLRLPTVAQGDPSHLARWVNAATRKHGADTPSLALRHNRRNAARAFYRVLRTLGLHEGDPTLDLQLPPRGHARGTRPLEDDELLLLQLATGIRPRNTALPSAVALAEATAGSGELGAVTIRHCQLGRGRVWLIGTAKTRPRWGYLTRWGTQQLRVRIAELEATGTGPDTPVLAGGAASPRNAQIIGCQLLNQALELAGLAGEPGVKPSSIGAAFGRRVFERTGNIRDVAQALGCRSLDAAARAVGYDWDSGPHRPEAELAACVLNGEPAPALDRGAAATLYRRSTKGRTPATSAQNGATRPRRRVPAVNARRIEAGQ